LGQGPGIDDVKSDLVDEVSRDALCGCVVPGDRQSTTVRGSGRGHVLDDLGGD
jgi:hypothetical protein